MVKVVVRLPCISTRSIQRHLRLGWATRPGNGSEIERATFGPSTSLEVRSDLQLNPERNSWTRVESHRAQNRGSPVAYACREVLLKTAGVCVQLEVIRQRFGNPDTERKKSERIIPNPFVEQVQRLFSNGTVAGALTQTTA